MLLLPAFVLIDNVTSESAPVLVEEFINKAPTTTSPLQPFTMPESIPLAPDPKTPAKANGSTSNTGTSTTPPPPPALTTRPCPHQVLILLCSQKTRDARCGQSAPLLRRELERHLRPLGLARDLDDTRPGGVGIYFISHVGGHKYSANMLMYRRPDAFGLDGGPTDPDARPAVVVEEDSCDRGQVGAAQCIWLARVRPKDCENIVRYTVLRGKVVKPERQLRGGFDRGRGLLSW